MFVIKYFYFIIIMQSRPTPLVWAGGQSSSRTPNVMPAGTFFSKGFLMIPAMSIFQGLSLSRGGLDSPEETHTHKWVIWGYTPTNQIKPNQTLTFQRPSLLAVRFPPQNCLFDAEWLPSYFGGGFWSAAGSAEEKFEKIQIIRFSLVRNVYSLQRVTPTETI